MSIFAKSHALFVCLSLWFYPVIALAEGIPEASGVAPDAHVIVERTVGGAYFVAREIHERFEKLKTEIARLEEAVLMGDVSEEEARKEIERLRTDLAAVLREIREKRVLVEAGKIYETIETGTFVLAQGQALFIDAAAVEVVGWDEPHAKWELKKTFLSEKELSPEEARQEFEKYGVRVRALTGSVFSHPRDIFDRSERRLVTQSPFEPIWQRDLQEVSIHGLLGQEGNHQITIRLTSENGGGSVSSQWRRHARLKIYVPRCDAVAIRGARQGLSVRTLKANLYIGGENDYDYVSSTVIDGIDGDVFVRNVPLKEIRNVSGSLSLVQSAPPENSGTRHFDDNRLSYHYEPPPIVCEKIGGDVRGWLLRAKISFRGVRGQINVRNDFGDTLLDVTSLPADKAHRIVSQSGTIHLVHASESDPHRPLFLATECGTIRVRGLRQELDTFSITTNAGSVDHQRNWNGFRPASKPGEFGFWFLPGGMERILEQEPGWDQNLYLFVFNRAGRIVCETIPEADAAAK